MATHTEVGMFSSTYTAAESRKRDS